MSNRQKFGNFKVCVGKERGVRPSLAPIYEGPYLVVQRYDKYFLIVSWEGEQKVSVDRLKTAYVSEEEPSENDTVLDDESILTNINSPLCLRRSNRIIKKPDRLDL